MGRLLAGVLAARRRSALERTRAGRGAARDPQRRGRPARARPVDPARAAGDRLRAGPDRRRGPARGADLGVRRARPGRRRAGARRPARGRSARAAVRAVGALDAAGPRDGPAFADAPEGIVTLRNVLPDWAARLIVGSLLLPALLAALDAFFRARRRRVPIAPWIAWLAVAAVPLPVAWLWLRRSARRARSTCPTARSCRTASRSRRSGIVALVSALLARRAGVLARALRPRGALRGRRAARSRPRNGAPRAARARRRRARGRDRRVALRARGDHLGDQPLRRRCCSSPPRTCGCSPPAAGAGWRRADRRCSSACCRSCSRSSTSASRSTSARTSWPGARRSPRGRRRRCGRRCCSAASWPRWRASSACCSRAAGSRATTTPGGAAIQTRGPVTYAGPGSLGGTESALRR